MAKELTFKDLDLILTMGANGFGLNTIHYVNGLMYIEMSRFESKDSTVRAILKQTETEGLKIYECSS